MGDEYDVRVVEMRLAEMAARRGQRGKAQTVTNAAPVVVGDFELRAIDAASDSEDDDDGSTSSASDGDDAVVDRGCNGVRKSKLRDSLDLSMSTSLVLPVGKMRVEKKKEAPKKHEKEVVAKTEQNKPPYPVATVLPASTATMKVENVVSVGSQEETSRYLLAGDLVRRRRELERQAERVLVQEASQASRREVASTRKDHEQACLVRQPQDRLVPPALTSNRQPQPSLATLTLKYHDGRVHHSFGPRQDQAILPIEHTIDTSVAIKAALSTKMQQDQPRGPTLIHLSHPVATKQEATNRASVIHAQEPLLNQHRGGDSGNQVKAAVTTKVSPPIGRPAASQQSTLRPTQQLEAPQNTSSAPISKAPSASISKKCETISIANKPGYARPAPASNQTAQPPTRSAADKVMEKLEPQEDSDDVIDDLLTAEEHRLRESLDKLTTRLSTINAARSKLPRKPPSNQPAPGKDGTDNAEKALKSAPYGGGTHVKLHQPASPSKRSSNVKRSELSGGVHKARVRAGGASALETTTARPDGESKHKIIVKKDLAHLLF